GVRQPRLDIFLVDPAARIRRQTAIERHEAAFGRDDHFVAQHVAALDRSAEGAPKQTLTALKAIVYGGVEVVAAERQRPLDRGLILLVSRITRFAEIRSQANRSNGQPFHSGAEMAWSRVASEARLVGGRSLRR